LQLAGCRDQNGIATYDPIVGDVGFHYQVDIGAADRTLTLQQKHAAPPSFLQCHLQIVQLLQVKQSCRTKSRRRSQRWLDGGSIVIGQAWQIYLGLEWLALGR